jgi:hypothetical protein
VLVSLTVLLLIVSSRFLEIRVGDSCASGLPDALVTSRRHIVWVRIEHSSISYKCRLGLRTVMREDGSFILEGRKERRELKLILPFPSFNIPIAHVCCF